MTDAKFLNRGEIISQLLGLIHALEKPISYDTIWSAIMLYENDWLCIKLLSDESKASFTVLTGTLPEEPLSTIISQLFKSKNYSLWSSVLCDMKINNWIEIVNEYSDKFLHIGITDKLPGLNMLPSDVTAKIPFVLEALKSLQKNSLESKKNV